MTALITRNGWIRIAVIAAIGLLLLPFSPGVRQQRNLRLAEKYAAKIRLRIQTDARFKHVQIGAYTSGGGSLLVRGQVNQTADQEALKKLVMAGQPLMRVHFMVKAVQPQADADLIENAHAAGN